MHYRNGDVKQGDRSKAPSRSIETYQPFSNSTVFFDLVKVIITPKLLILIKSFPISVYEPQLGCCYTLLWRVTSYLSNFNLWKLNPFLVLEV